jgi:hypothetical protein
MIKQTIFTITIIGLIFVACLPCQGADNIIYGCYQKEHGQLRIVNDYNQCLLSELPITWNQSCESCNGGSIGKLACVTAMMKNPTETSAEIMITNQKNIIVSDWVEVFNAFYVQPDPDSPEDIYWGLQCKDDWVNTGCNQSVECGEPRNVDLPQYNNGCFSDDEEIEYLDIFTTCCKVMEN